MAYTQYRQWRLTLLTQLQSADFGWQVNNAGDRLVIFSERIETLHWLQKQLSHDLKLKPNQVAVLSGPNLASEIAVNIATTVNLQGSFADGIDAQLCERCRAEAYRCEMPDCGAKAETQPNGRPKMWTVGGARMQLCTGHRHSMQAAS